MPYISSGRVNTLYPTPETSIITNLSVKNEFIDAVEYCYNKKRRMNQSTMFEKIFAVVAEIPQGKVMSYQAVAEAAGVKSPRWVGRAMHANTDSETVPCHRVVNKDGRLALGYAFGGIGEQRARLIAEGVKFRDDLHVKMN